MKKIKSALWIALAVVSVLAPERASAQEVTFDPNTDLLPIVVPAPPRRLPSPRFGYSVCPPRSVTHWDKIIFSLGRLQQDIDEHPQPTDDELHPAVMQFAKNLRIRPHEPLDIKVLDNPREVADLKEKVAVFLLRRQGVLVSGADTTNKEKVEELIPLIYIHDVDYAIICSALPHFQPIPVPTPVITSPQ